jgi:hypothetical protein
VNQIGATIKLHEVLQSQKSPEQNKMLGQTFELDNACTPISLSNQVRPTDKLYLYVKSARGHRRTHSDTNSFSKQSLNFSAMVTSNTKKSARFQEPSKMKVNLKSTLEEKFSNFKGVKNTNLTKSYNHHQS